ncbi:synaptonemal complex central element protein 1-like isoform X2 [Erinaceus europaeus]|uniref:Synaptonemal complex central element protein 1-like isoform X2 n=1 Tax=Erinaceus europaeus TaxID=9365 RepID=A0ABM3WX21_ERIEU|nr:synaptonemal complex central element protein 1-like isoform X2 [Erinaceus europaeus]
MAGEMKPQKTEPPGVMEEVEGQNKSSKKTEDLLAIVKKLLKEGSLAPQIEDQINRINELQQAKKKSGELGEAQALWETVHRELDSLNEEKLHLEEVLSKKQEALQILQLHCQRKRSETQRNHMSPENVEDMPIQNSQITDSLPQSAQGLHVGKQLEDLKGQQKDIWEFQMLQHRLAWEIRALQGSQEQLLTEENQARAKLLELERQLCSPPEVETPQPDTKAAPADDESLTVDSLKTTLGSLASAQRRRRRRRRTCSQGCTDTPIATSLQSPAGNKRGGFGLSSSSLTDSVLQKALGWPAV